MKRRSRAGRETIKRRLGKTPEPKSRNAPKAAARSNMSSTGEETEIARLTRERNEALEQQSATSEVLQVISSAPGELKVVFDAILPSAVRICDATFGVIYRWDGELLHALASHKMPPAFAEARKRRPIRPHLARIVATKSIIHIADAAAHM